MEKKYHWFIQTNVDPYDKNDVPEFTEYNEETNDKIENAFLNNQSEVDTYYNNEKYIIKFDSELGGGLSINSKYIDRIRPVIRIAKEKDIEDYACLTCTSLWVNIQFFPCQHSVLCKKCYDEMKSKKGDFSCPKCRAKIEKTMNRNIIKK